MTTAADVLGVARRHLGSGEHPPGSNRTPFGAWYGLDGNPWCAMFVSRCFFDAGLPLSFTTAKGFAYCPSGVAAFRRLGRWRPGTARPQAGDVVFFKFTTRPDHVGIVEDVKPDGTVVTIEGNTGNVVARKLRRKAIYGYGVPAYAAAGPPRAEAPKLVTVAPSVLVKAEWPIGSGLPSPERRYLPGILSLSNEGSGVGKGGAHFRDMPVVPVDPRVRGDQVHGWSVAAGFRLDGFESLAGEDARATLKLILARLGL